jgi:hypothetical protein
MTCLAAHGFWKERMTEDKFSVLSQMRRPEILLRTKN